MILSLPGNQAGFLILPAKRFAPKSKTLTRNANAGIVVRLFPKSRGAPFKAVDWQDARGLLHRRITADS
jgi:hypothetical protein